MSNIIDLFYLFCISPDQIVIPTAPEGRTGCLCLVQVLFSAVGACGTY